MKTNKSDNENKTDASNHISETLSLCTITPATFDDKMNVPDFENEATEINSESPLFYAAACEKNYHDSDQVQDDSSRKSFHPVVDFIKLLLQNKSEDKVLDMNINDLSPDLDGTPPEG